MTSTTELLELLPDGQAVASVNVGEVDPRSIPLRVFRPDSPRAAPAVIVLHGQGASGERWAHVGLAMADAGMLVVLPDARLHGRRRSPAPDPSDTLPVLDFLDVVLGTAEDVRRVTDYLLSGAEACDGTVGVRGFSMGGQIALLAAAHDQRLDPVCVVAGIFPPVSADPAVYAASTPDGAALARRVRALDRLMSPGRFADRQLLLVRGRDDPALDTDVAQTFVGDVAAVEGSGHVDEVVYAGGHHPPAWVDSALMQWFRHQLNIV